MEQITLVRERRMHKGFRSVAIMMVISVALSACGNRSKEPDLVNFPRTRTPDEFTVLPNKPLEAPESYAALPTPTPGGDNRVDPTPGADAVVALGGSAQAVTRNGTIGNDAGLLAFASRYGREGNIRQVLASEDIAYRRDNDGRLLERWFNVNIYYKAYEDQSLDQHKELLRLRRLGIRTPAAPPSPED